MKQILVLLALSAVLVCSCSSGEEESKQEWPAFTLDKTEVEIYAHETAGIIPSEAFTAWSENEKVATVDTDGTIHGMSEGETDVVFKANASGKETRCQAKVSWRYHYYVEPVMILGASNEEIRAKETHKLVDESTLANGRLLFLTYDYDNQAIPILVTYEFNFYDELMTIKLKFKDGTDHFDEIKQQLDERYGDTEDILSNKHAGYRTYYLREQHTAIIHTPWEFVYLSLYA